MTRADQLVKVKQSLNITGTALDDTLGSYLDEVKLFMTNAGVNALVVDTTEAIGCICRGVADLYINNELSQYFYQRVSQLYSAIVVTPDPTPAVTVTGFELYPDGSGIITAGRIIMSDGSGVEATIIYPDTLTLTSTSTDNIGETIVTVTPALTDGNQYKIKAQISTTLSVPAINTDVSDWDDWDGTSVINATGNWGLVVCECDQYGKVKKGGWVKVSARIF